MTTWQDSGRILPFQKRTREENKRVFADCCNRDTLSVLHGKLYRCPFSANAHNLKAVPNLHRLPNLSSCIWNTSLEIKIFLAKHRVSAVKS